MVNINHTLWAIILNREYGPQKLTLRLNMIRLGSSSVVTNIHGWNSNEVFSSNDCDILQAYQNFIKVITSNVRASLAYL